MPKAVVIGAGVAGISAALTLAKKNYEVTVLETRNFHGGRIYSFTDKTTGELIDNGQHIIVGAYTNFLSILDELGTRGMFKKQESLRVPFIYRDGRVDILDASRLPGRAGVIAGLMCMHRLSFKSRIGILKFFVRLQLDKVRGEGISCLDMLRSEAQANDSIEYFWTPLILATLNAQPGMAAASLLLSVLKKAFFSGPENSRILLPSRGLSELLEPFPRVLNKYGGRIIYRSAVNNLIYDENKIKSVVINDGEKIDADIFVCAVQPRVLKKILPEEVAAHDFFRSLEDYKYSSIISIYLWFDTDFVPFDFAALLQTNTQWVFNRRHFIRPDLDIINKYPGHMALTISGADNLVDKPDEEIVSLCISELYSAFHPARKPELLNYFIIKDRFATFMATPEMEKKRLKQATPISNLFLCGDWTDTGLPATIEGAAVSGRIMF